MPGELARALFRGTRSDEMPLKGSTAPSRIAHLKVEQLEFQSFKKVNFKDFGSNFGISKFKSFKWTALGSEKLSLTRNGYAVGGEQNDNVVSEGAIEKQVD